MNPLKAIVIVIIIGSSFIIYKYALAPVVRNVSASSYREEVEELVDIPNNTETLVTGDSQAITEASSTQTTEENPFCSCVRTAYNEGVNMPLIDAKDFIPNTTMNEADLVLLYYKSTNTYHVAKILKIDNEGIYIVEGNFKKCKKTFRTLKLNDPALRGFWKNEKV